MAGTPNDETLYISDIAMRIEMEEREEQVYEDDGVTPVTKAHAADADTVNKAHRTRVKLKRYFYRLAVTVTKSAKVFDGPSKVGKSIGKMKSGGPFGINGDTGIRYLCSDERATPIDLKVDLWMLSQSWSGFTPWKKVPKDWDLDQASEKVEEETPESGGDT